MRGRWFAATLSPMELPVGITTRSLRPDDAREVFDLMVDSQTLDAGEPSVDLEDVVGDWQRPSFDLATHAVGVEDAGRLVGYAHVANGRYADAAVASTHRGRGIGTWLAAWTQAEARRQGGSMVGMPVPVASDGDHLLERLGYHVAWTSWVLQLGEGERIEGQPLPEGYAVRPLRPGEEHVAYRVVEDAFNEWPDRQPVAYDDWAARVVRRPGFEPWHLRLATDPGGEVVGVGYVFVSGEYGYVPTLAVRRDQRGRGLARALLVDSFAVAREHGASRSELSTDSRTGALGLYERVGMRITSTWVHRATAV
jgi:ribosomal protein S18 acetylase RimI-like enzyme